MYIKWCLLHANIWIYVIHGFIIYANISLILKFPCYPALSSILTVRNSTHFILTTYLHKLITRYFHKQWKAIKLLCINKSVSIIHLLKRRAIPYVVSSKGTESIPCTFAIKNNNTISYPKIPFVNNFPRNPEYSSQKNKVKNYYGFLSVYFAINLELIIMYVKFFYFGRKEKGSKLIGNISCT